jgi:hypothetical protein
MNERGETDPKVGVERANAGDEPVEEGQRLEDLELPPGQAEDLHAGARATPTKRK